MKVLVYGSKGWIGSQFVALLADRDIEYIEGTSRVDHEDSVRAEIDAVKPSHVVTLTGRTHGTIGDKVFTTIDYLEQDGKLLENLRDNLYGPLVLSEICKAKEIHLTYLGTGCIFKFDEDHPYGQEVNGFEEDCSPNFFGSSYSVVKGYTDRLMKFFKDDVLNIRIRMPITGSYNKRNFITKITTYEKICSVPNSMTVLPELLPLLIDLMQSGSTGTINFTNPGLISHNEILEMYKEIVDPDFTYQNFSEEEQRKILAADRSNNYLDTRKVESLFPSVLPIREAVRKCLMQYKDTLPKAKELNDKEQVTNAECNNNITQDEQKKDHDKLNLLVTGGCGFIGSNFINYYFPQDKVDKLVNLDAMYYCANEENIDKSIRNNDYYIFVKGNVGNMDTVKNILSEYNITHIIHFAAQSHVCTSFTDALQYTQDNIVGSHTLLEACRQHEKLKRFVFVSTDEVYGESSTSLDELQKTELSILCPTNPYAATKASAELIAQSYIHSFRMPIIITRGNNVFGPNQFHEKLIPKFIEKLCKGEKVPVIGDGSAVRAFLHSSDVAKAFQLILEEGVVGEIYNIGCDEGMEYSVMEVVQMLVRLVKGEEDYERWIIHAKDRPFHDQRYYISNQKLKDLGWDIEVGFEEGLKELIQSYQM